MVNATDPNTVIGELAAAGLAVGLLWRFFAWLNQRPRTPDPWGEEIERKLHEPDAIEICHRCFEPRTSAGWFCEHCGSAIGPYNNLMPFVNVFSEGEVFRNGVNDHLRRGPLIVLGYLLLSLSAYVVFAPIYWIFLFRNLRRWKEEPPRTPSEETGPIPPDSPA
jgi:hypothetical protein